MLRLLPTLILASLLAGSAGAQLLPIVIDGGGGGGGAAPDWTSAFVTVWEADNSAASSGGTCGTDCDLAAQGGATFDATNVWSGTHAFDLDGVDDSFTCTAATCNEIVGLTGSVSAVCAARPTTGFSNFPGIMDWFASAIPGGVRWNINGSAAPVVNVSDGTDTQDEIAATALTLDAWNHVGFSHEAGVAIRPYLNGASNCSGACTVQQALAAGTANFNLGDQSTSEWQGQLDECGIYSGVIGPESMCRICSCGIDGAQCTISGTSFTDTGRNSTACGSCTLPTDASQAAPGTN